MAGLCLLFVIFVFLVPALMGWKFSVVEGGSMEPAISVGEIIAVEPVEPDKIKSGDIISFKFPDRIPITHRVTEVIESEEGLSFQTKGDANEDPDPYLVASGNLIGRVRFHVAGIGYFSRFVHTPTGALAFVVVPGMIVIGAEIRYMFIRKPKWLQTKKTGQVNRRVKQGCAVVTIGAVIGLGGFMAQNSQQITLDYKFNPNNTYNSVISQRVLQNGTSFPSLVCLMTDNSNVAFSDNRFMLGSGEDRTVDIALKDSAGVSQGKLTYRTGSFLPLLPAGAIHALASWNFRLSPFVLACVPVFPLALLGYLILRQSGDGHKWQKQRKTWRKSHV